jgi:hypothetical protein
MTIQILNDETKSFENLGNTYRWVEMQCGKHRAIVTVVTGEFPRVNVVVMNAAAKAWKRLTGKTFKTIEEAVSAYKTSEVKAIISHAA